MNGIFRRAVAFLVAGLLLTLPAQTLQATEPSSELQALQKEVLQLKAGQREILKRLDALQKSVGQGGPRARQQTPFKGADISIAGEPTKGNATLVLIEFSDYQCPFCRRFSDNTLPKILETYVATGKLRYVFRDFPIPRSHPAAIAAAVAARCAGQQGKYWEMHDRFFADPKSVQARKWKDHAKALNLDGTGFDACMADERHERAVRQSMMVGRKIGVTGTPAFYLGTLAADGKTVKATEMIRGARPYASFKQVIDRMLAAKKSG